MSSVRPLWNAWLRVYYRWALSEIDPMHPDVPHIVFRLNELESANA